jgi:hypothetical protein
MKGLLRIFALLTAASMLIWIAGCGEEEAEEEAGPPPSVDTVTLSEGQQIAGNASITVSFSKAVESADITVSGATGTVTGLPGKTAIWTPSPDIPPGAHTLTITAEDSAGQGLDPAFTPVNFTAIAPDPDPPVLDDAKCDPKNGADGVDPADYPEKIEIAFNEALSAAKVTAAEPEFKSTEELSADGKVLTITFLQYSMPNETEFVITVSATDLAGNTAELEYGFTTMEKEQ